MENETRLGRGMKTGTKVLRILDKIAWIFAFVAAGFSLLGGVCMAALRDVAITVEGTTLTFAEHFESVSSIAFVQGVVMCFTAFLGMLAAGIEGIQVEGFFKAALREEGYFKPAVAKACRNLGIFLLVSATIAVILQGITIGVASVFETFEAEGLAWAWGGGSGIFFLVLSLFLYRGCELIEAKKEEDAR